MSMSYEEALDFIHSVSWMGSRPGLTRITELMHRLGNPQDDLKFIHVAGTNGKGSVCAMTESILRHAGFKTGLFTSPYIWRFNERMAIDGQPITDEELAEITEYVRPYAEAMEDKPTEFELITALGFVYFAKHHCDVVVLEVGMGGRLDSTNIILPPLACVITGIAFDHTALLGNTIEEIAAEKAGIIKGQSPVIFGGTDPKAINVILKVASDVHSQYVQTNPNRLTVHSMDLSGCLIDYRYRKNIRVSLPGVYQTKNVMTVLELIDILIAYGMDIPEQAIYDGLANTHWAGRFETLCQSPLIISDGSHNPEGISAAVSSIRHYFASRPIHLLTGVMADKDYSAMVGELAPLCKQVYTIQPHNPRALGADALALVYQKMGVIANPYTSAKDALIQAIQNSKSDNAPIVCLGSLYMYSEVKEAVLSLT